MKPPPGGRSKLYTYHKHVDPILLDLETWWYWLLSQYQFSSVTSVKFSSVASSPISQKNVHALIRLLPSWLLKLWVLVAWTPCMELYNKCYICLHHNLLSIDWLYCMQTKDPSLFWTCWPEDTEGIGWLRWWNPWNVRDENIFELREISCLTLLYLAADRKSFQTQQSNNVYLIFKYILSLTGDNWISLEMRQ